MDDPALEASTGSGVDTLLDRLVAGLHHKFGDADLLVARRQLHAAVGDARLRWTEIVENSGVPARMVMIGVAPIAQGEELTGSVTRSTISDIRSLASERVAAFKPRSVSWAGHSKTWYRRAA